MDSDQKKCAYRKCGKELVQTINSRASQLYCDLNCKDREKYYRRYDRVKRGLKALEQVGVGK
jgi:hypothetical protein